MNDNQSNISKTHEQRTYIHKNQNTTQQTTCSNMQAKQI